MLIESSQWEENIGLRLEYIGDPIQSVAFGHVESDRDIQYGNL